MIYCTSGMYDKKNNKHITLLFFIPGRTIFYYILIMNYHMNI